MWLCIVMPSFMLIDSPRLCSTQTAGKLDKILGLWTVTNLFQTYRMSGKDLGEVYIYIFKVNPPKQSLVQPKQGAFGFQYVFFWILMFTIDVWGQKGSMEKRSPNLTFASFGCFLYTGGQPQGFEMSSRSMRR